MARRSPLHSRLTGKNINALWPSRHAYSSDLVSRNAEDPFNSTNDIEMQCNTGIGPVSHHNISDIASANTFDTTFRSGTTRTAPSISGSGKFVSAIIPNLQTPSWSRQRIRDPPATDNATQEAARECSNLRQELWIERQAKNRLRQETDWLSQAAAYQVHISDQLRHNFDSLRAEAAQSTQRVADENRELQRIRGILVRDISELHQENQAFRRQNQTLQEQLERLEARLETCEIQNVGTRIDDSGAARTPLQERRRPSPTQSEPCPELDNLFSKNLRRFGITRSEAEERAAENIPAEVLEGNGSAQPKLDPKAQSPGHESFDDLDDLWPHPVDPNYGQTRSQRILERLSSLGRRA